MDVNRLLKFITEASRFFDFMNRRRAWMDNLNCIKREKDNDASTGFTSSRFFFLFMGMLLHHLFITQGLIFKTEFFMCPFSKRFITSMGSSSSISSSRFYLFLFIEERRSSIS
jgi:hypothetical protein